jgi:hypothetical protein
MAADLETKTTVPKYEAFVEDQLARVRARIRALDVGRSLMMLGVVTLAYFLVVAAFDLSVKGADDALVTGVRLAAFAIYALVMLFVFGQLAVRLYRRINPFYAARQLEEIIPDAKNSVINWLDLKGQELPGAIRSAVGQRAARELKQTDPDRAVNPRINWLMGGVLAGLGLGLLVLFALGPNQFGSLLGRAFFTPFFTTLNTKTEITLLRPAGGDVSVPLGQRVEFQAQIEGRFPKTGQPGAPRLLYRYQTADSYVPLALDEALDGTWTATILADQVQNGFWYKIAAGDKETPEYQVKVQSLPQATRFEVTYHYRPYRKLADDRVIFPNENAIFPRLKDYRGTEVKLVVRTNRDLRAGRLQVESGGAKYDLPGEILSDDARAMGFSMTLDKRGVFRVLFISKGGEENTDRTPYQIEVLDDLAPRVVLTKPGRDISLPPSGTLQLEGSAQDDVGLKSLALRVKVLEGEAQPVLQPKDYRPGKSFQFDNGTYPDFLDYKDFVSLDKLKTVRDEPFALKAGMVLEYWLEATDNCDYPHKGGNVGKSEAFKVTIAENTKDHKKQQEERKQAEDQQRKHEQKQDQKNTKENQKRNQAQGGGDSQSNDKEKKDFEEKLDKVREALNKDKKGGDNNQSNNPDPQPGENKSGAQGAKADNKESKDATKAGDQKNKGDNSQADQAGQSKDQGSQEQGEKKPGEAKGPGTGDQKSAAEKGDGGKDNSTDKSTPTKNDTTGQQPKTQGQNEGDSQKGTEKSSAKGDDSGSSGKGTQAKEDKDHPGAKSPQAKGKDGNPGGQKETVATNKAGSNQPSKAEEKPNGSGSQTEAGSGKDGPMPQSEPKGAVKGTDTENTSTKSKTDTQNPRASDKGGGNSGSGKQQTASNGAAPNDSKKTASPKDKQASEANSREATRQDVADLEKKLQDQGDGKEARDKLAHAAKEGKDPQARKAAQDTLDKLDQEAKANYEELSRLARDAKDGEVRKAAQDVLDKLDQQAKANPQPGTQRPKSTQGTPQTGSKDRKQENSNQPAPTQAAESGAPKGREGIGNGQGSKEADGQPGAKLGNSGPGGKGASDDLSKDAPDSASAKRGGDLQLDDLKKRMTPETLKKLGWSNEDWQRFLRDAEAYQKSVRNRITPPTNPNRKGVASALPNAPVREVDRGQSNPLEILQADLALPPPEFRDAQRQFTNPQRGKK